MWGSRGSRHVSSRVLQPLPDWVRLGWWKSSKHSPGADLLVVMQGVGAGSGQAQRLFYMPQCLVLP